jgi:UDP-N-acetylmuramate-alanine ligase
MNAAPNSPLELGPIHFVGIGGIGMSGIAEVLMTWATGCRGRTRRHRRSPTGW